MENLFTKFILLLFCNSSLIFKGLKIGKMEDGAPVGAITMFSGDCFTDWTEVT